MKKKILPLAMFFVITQSVFPLTSWAQQRSDIVDTAVAAGSFNTLAAALTEAGLVNTLKGKGPFTVFAPTDEAFAKLPKGTVESLLKPENRDQLIDILTYHVVKDRVRAEEVATLQNAVSVNGQRVDIKTENGQLFVDDAQVVTADIRATNGIIHVIDEVLLPESKTIPEIADAAGTFSTLLAAVTEAGLAGALSGDGPFTVLAPTDEAFAALPEGTVESLLKPENKATLQQILKYHVIEGRAFASDFLRKSQVSTLAGEKLKLGYKNGMLMVNGANVIGADIQASNGVVHVIDAVLLPDAEETASLEAEDVIRLAIDRGVPLFNHGQRGACAAIYEVAASSLVMSNMPENAKQPLRTALRKIERTHSNRDRAWILRTGLDDSLAMLEEKRMRMN